MLNLTMALYGAPKAGKTWMAATAPRPVIIAAAPERGWTALTRHANWANITVLPCPLIPGLEQISGDPKMRPAPEWARVKDAKPRSAIADMEHVILRRIREEYKHRDWQTVVIDTTTLIAEMYVSELSHYGGREMGGKGGGQWTVLKQHLLNIVNALQALPLHVIWTFHTGEVRNGDIILRLEPGVVGSNWRKVFAPTVRLIGYLNKEQRQDNETGEIETVRGLLVKCPPNHQPPFEAGGDFEECFSGKDWCLAPTWEALAKRLG